MKKHKAAWRAPAPLWDQALADGGAAAQMRFKRPAILCFDKDSFMDDLAGMLADDPADLNSIVFRHGASPGLAAQLAPNLELVQQAGARPARAALSVTDLLGLSAGPASQFSELAQPTLLPPPKLYQPVHGRFYLVAASLACLLPGLPERAVKAAKGDRLSFVVRRLGESGEMAWIGDRESGFWQTLPDEEALAEHEEQLPLFSTSFDWEDVQRRLHAGFIPVAGREMYEKGQLTMSTYVLRCVYERPRCQATEDAVLSARSLSFRLAPYSDPDAPSRPVQIRLPDSFPGRPSGPSFVLPEGLARVLGRLDGVDLGDPPKPDPGALGKYYITTLSIPIITVVAYAMLQIIVSMLHIVFGWLPFFKTVVEVEVD